jgi:hypothetical protein
MAKKRQKRDLDGRVVALLAVALVVVAGLMVYKLGSLVGGVSAAEHAVASTPVGWHGIYHQPLYLPLKLVRSIDFFIFNQHGQTLTRLPSVLFGILAIASFAWVVKLWHGTRTAILATCLFASSAWVLHVSRLASFDALYLWTIPALLVAQLKMQRSSTKPAIFYGSVLLWGLLLYIPGVIWLILPSLYWQRQAIKNGWRHFSRWWQRLAYLLLGLVWLPLLGHSIQNTAILRTWIGLPPHFSQPLTLLKNFAGVFVHLFIRGPEYPQLWLGRAPLLDVFALATCLIGLYFYAQHWRASRSRVLGTFFLLGAVLIALGGPVGLSLLVPVLYLVAATGIAYLIREWLQVFPVNPLARGFGLGIIILAVALSCTYNARAYYVAWPHNPVTPTVFRYHLEH